MEAKNTNKTILTLSLAVLLVLFFNLFFQTSVWNDKKVNKEVLIQQDDVKILVNELNTNVFPNESNLTVGDTFDVEIAISGEKADLSRVADLMFDYDDNLLEFISASSDGFFVNPTFFKKDEWNNKRFVLMSNSVDVSMPLIKLTFKALDVTNFGIVKLLPESQIYISQDGAKNLSSKEFSYNISSI